MEGFEVGNKDLFQTLKIDAKAMSQIVAREFDAFYCHHVNVENYKCALSLWHIHEQRWPLVGSLAQQIIGIPTSQIETEWIFLIVGILVALKKCQLQTNHLDQSKGWVFLAF